MSEELEEYVLCWKCFKQTEPDLPKCQKCGIDMFTKDGDEIICQEQYNNNLEFGFA